MNKVSSCFFEPISILSSFINLNKIPSNADKLFERGPYIIPNLKIVELRLFFM